MDGAAISGCQGLRLCGCRKKNDSGDECIAAGMRFFDHESLQDIGNFYCLRRRVAPNRPASAMPSNASVVGSGTVVTSPPVRKR